MRKLAKMTDYSSKNTFRVDLENFQSISKASLEFVQGINIIVGQSNSGKSAILRAVKGSVLNPSGSQKYIKNKTKGFKVNINYAGNNIEWSREKSPKYIVNGEEYKKTGNSNLTDLVDNSGFVLDEDKNLMNIESELELPFPFDKSNSELFKLFEKNIFCVSDSTAIVKLIKADEDEANKNKDNAEYELERSKNKLQAITELEAEVDLDKLINGRNALAGLINNKEKLTLDITDLHDKINVGKVLNKAIPMVEVNQEVIDNYVSLLADTKKLNEIRGVGKVLQAMPTASTPDALNISDYTELKDAITQLEQANELTSILSPLEAPTMRDVNGEYTSLRSDINSLLQLREQAQMVQKNISDLQAQIDLLKIEKGKIKVCPLCGNKINE